MRPQICRALRPFLIALLLTAGAAQAELPVIEHVLPNGMRFLIVEDHTSPSFLGAWVAHVGAVNEQPGQTGLTHLLEHMMFKGSRIIGTKDLQKDLALIERQEQIKETIRDRSRTLRDDVRQGRVATLREAQLADTLCQRLENEFQVLVAEQRENMIPNEFDEIMKKNGELFGNAFTSSDMTAYFNVLPANKLELWFWMESDRLINPVFREIYAERDVVYEERRMRTESTPTGIHEEAVNAMFWQASPYSAPIIGWPSDVSELSMKQAQDYYHTYYGPNNVTAIITGDVDVEQVKELATRYFGRMEPRENPPALVTLEPAQLGEKRYVGEVDINPTVNLRYHCGGFKHVDSGVLQVIASLLNGDSGRLQRRLIQEKKAAVRAYAYYENNKYEGAFQIEGEAAQGISNDELEAALGEEIRLLVEEPVVDRELQKVKNAYFVDSYREAQSSMRAGFQLIQNAGSGDWRENEVFAKRIQDVQAADIQRVAAQILRPENRLVTWWVRKEGSSPAKADPAGLAELPAQMQGMARQFIGQIGQQTDAAMLQGILAQLQGQESEDENERALSRVLVEAVNARIAALAGDAQTEGGR